MRVASDGELRCLVIVTKLTQFYPQNRYVAIFVIPNLQGMIFLGAKNCLQLPCKRYPVFSDFCVTECDALRQEMGCTDAQGEVMNCANTNVRKRRCTVKNKEVMH